MSLTINAVTVVIHGFIFACLKSTISEGKFTENCRSDEYLEKIEKSRCNLNNGYEIPKPSGEAEKQNCVDNEEYLSSDEIQSKKTMKTSGKISVKVDVHRNSESDLIYQEVIQTESEYCKLQTIR